MNKVNQKNLEGIFPIIMTPSHDGKFFANYMTSILNLTQEAYKLGLPLQVYLHTGESLITRARNHCVAEFLSKGHWTHLFWIDSDIGFSVQAALRLLSSGYDVAAGVYPLKRENWPSEGLPQATTKEQFESLYTHYTCNSRNSGQSDRVDLVVGPDGFIKVTEAPTGFMVIKREVIERMIKAFPDLEYVPDSLGVDASGMHYRLFDVMVDPVSRRYLSEDYGFCHLWASLGEHIYIDACSNLSHQGQKSFRGNFAHSLLHSLPLAVGAPQGMELRLHGAQHLVPNDQPPM